MGESAESKPWLYNQPTAELAKDWYDRNQGRFQTSWYSPPPIIDLAVVLVDPFVNYDGTLNTRYKAAEVFMTKDGPDVPQPGSQLWRIRQAYTQSDTAKIDFNGSKLHLHAFSPPLSDTYLILQASNYDWHGMRTLNMGLRDRQIPQHYRDEIMPTQTAKGFVLASEHPNFLAVHGIIITSDGRIVNTTRAAGADFHGGTVSVSFEEQMDGEKDHSPFDTFNRAVAGSPKLRLGEEIKLNMIPESIRLAAMILEPDVNSIGFVIIGRCQEETDQIDPSKLGTDRAEFDIKQPISTMTAHQLVANFFHQNGFRWHGSSRLRGLVALSYLYGYSEAIDRLERARIEFDRNRHSLSLE